eukprot:CAMPEP_0176469474 /NCGR_PEP_ID=MMETSP0127-20121128/39823_1 /TAXON_ID=938130 /ORGANISM="Platyophrya macrostoma, Strain WH" /LENGTH=42 /DNA_ID= /DNA_START= /DNA_END= /DNA_ORIENTATION=
MRPKTNGIWNDAAEVEWIECVVVVVETVDVTTTTSSTSPPPP